jgi:hypothetical protein
MVAAPCEVLLDLFLQLEIFHKHDDLRHINLRVLGDLIDTIARN